MSLHVALLHYPIIDKTGAAVCTSITNLDLHDLSRAATTYGVASCWLVHPYDAQRRFTERVMAHWRDGWGAAYNPSRRESLQQTFLAADLMEVRTAIEAAEGRPPLFVGTHAVPVGNVMSYRAMRQEFSAHPEIPYCVVFGTGWGLHPELMAELDLMLEPIYGPTPWNHLSVRAAIGIILDRLCGLDHPFVEK